MKINTKYIKICPFDVNRFYEVKRIKNIYFSYIWCDVLLPLISNNTFNRKINKLILASNKNDRIFNFFYIYNYIFTKLLIVKRDIKNKVNSYITKFNRNFIGLQMRLGNHDLKEKQFSNFNDTRLIIREAKKCKKYKRWFLTGDSQILKNKLSKIYKNIFLYTTNITKHYAKYKSDSSIIIEHEILSKSKFMIISRSTFGLTALLKSKLLLDKSSHNCLEITNGMIYEITNNFSNFYLM